MPAKRRKKVRYRKVMLKLSPKQNRSLENYCKARRTTPGRLIKKVIRPYLAGYDKHVPEEFYVSERQLDMFEEVGSDIK